MKLNLKTKFLGQKIQFFDTITSTQEYVKIEEKKNNITEGEIIFAERQTAGVGTHQRKWYTGKNNNLAFSFVLFPNCDIKKLDKLTTIIAESMVQAVKELYLITLQIKKPNDIMYQNKKMGGILTESITEGTIAKKVFIGIGFNVNQEIFPGNLGDIATSLKKEFNADFSREDILARFLEIFEKNYLDLLK
ncbi:MAG: biotin--[acetyl-CoA-carboxylase] ligase [Clostridia bacterium]|nr:biotin--[acetyl-CoA-carboxylase] ligase [Clostridia bacterium]